MTKNVVVKIEIDPNDLSKTKAIVRKTVHDESGHIISTYSLSADGEWIRKPEAEQYTDECILPVVIYSL